MPILISHSVQPKLIRRQPPRDKMTIQKSENSPSVLSDVSQKLPSDLGQILKRCAGGFSRHRP